MPTVHDQLAAEESRLARLIRWRPTGSAETINAKTAEVKAAVARVKLLREQARPRASQGWAEGLAERDRRAAQRKAAEPARRAFGLVRSYGHPELVGVSLNASKLSEDEGKELLALVSERIDNGLSGHREKRYKRLIATAAGTPKLWDLAEAKAEAEERETAAAERAREAAMPVRTYTGKGGAYLPGYLHGWLHNAEEGGFSVVDLAVLALFVLAVEHGRSPFARSEFQDGRIVVDSALGFVLLPVMNPNGDLGERRVRDAVVFLNANDLLDIGTAADGRTTVTLGSRARRELEAATPDAA